MMMMMMTTTTMMIMRMIQMMTITGHISPGGAPGLSEKPSFAVGTGNGSPKERGGARREMLSVHGAW